MIDEGSKASGAERSCLAWVTEALRRLAAALAETLVIDSGGTVYRSRFREQ